MAPSKKNVLEALEVLYAFFDTTACTEEMENEFYAVHGVVNKYLSRTQNQSQTKITNFFLAKAD